MKKTLIILAILVIAAGGYWFITKPAAAPGEEIEENRSQVEFNIYEKLNGEDKIVVGTTNQVSGEFKVGETIRVNARTLKTDDSDRDNAIKRFILKTDDFEFVEFTITDIEEDSDGSIKITGDLTVTGITKEVVFSGEIVEIDSEKNIRVETVINRSDFDLVVPDFPFLADVGEEVTLKADLWY